MNPTGISKRGHNKKKLLLYLSKLDYPCNVLIASTLAWLSKSKGYFFDNYYDSYHQGIHFPGGDARNLEMGQLTGGSVCGGRHFGEFYFILHNFDVSIVSTGGTIFEQCSKNLNIPILSCRDRITDLYKDAFNSVNALLPSSIVMVGAEFGKQLSGLEAYVYPEIYYRQAIGVPDSITDEELTHLYGEGSIIFCLYVDKNIINRLSEKGYNVEVVDQLQPNDDYFSVTRRITQRWDEKGKGWVLGDPVLVTHWLPTACEEDLLAVYSVPQEKVVSQLGEIISSKGKVVYGRQYSDRDFFELSKLNQCFQIIDPCRPPFQSVKHVKYDWNQDETHEGFFQYEYSDDQLKQFAREGKILTSLLFWSGMIREVENFHNLIDLIAMTQLRCGLIVTAQSYEYMKHSPFELLQVPLKQGGVYPLVEPVLGSCGIGVGIESYIDNNRLEKTLLDALARISRRVENKNYMPRGWWPTMDADIERLSWLKSPKTLRLLKYPPYVQFRFHVSNEKDTSNQNADDSFKIHSAIKYLSEKIKSVIRNSGLMKYFEPYRPYEFFQAGSIKKDVIEAPQRAGIQYMFTKSGFNELPGVKYINDRFIAMNYTAGQWDGWTPFETINHVSDLKTSEKVLLNRKKPGWIVSTIDSCLWTFSGEFWKRADKLFEIAQFCANGGNSGDLINVKPFTISRYARIIAEEN